MYNSRVARWYICYICWKNKRMHSSPPPPKKKMETIAFVTCTCARVQSYKSLQVQFYKSNFTSPILQVQFFLPTSPVLQALLAQPRSKCLLLLHSKNTNSDLRSIYICTPTVVFMLLCVRTMPRDQIRTDPNCVSRSVKRHGATLKSLFVYIGLYIRWPWTGKCWYI
jgi:hypothetical protein